VGLSGGGDPDEVVFSTWGRVARCRSPDETRLRVRVGSPGAETCGADDGNSAAAAVPGVLARCLAWGSVLGP
jgi:hypothetical protein